MNKQTVVYSYNEMLLSNKNLLFIHPKTQMYTRDMPSEKSRNKRIHTLKSHSHKVQELAKLIYGDRNQNSSCLGGRGLTLKDIREVSVMITEVMAA